VSLYMTVCGFPPGAKQDYYLKIWQAAMGACLQEGGSISHHHGMGLHRALWMREENNVSLDILKAIKNTFDPAGIMNPGKLGLGEVGKWQR
jgi:alkyldihydroxyacetonephosphate synthase